MAKVALVVAWVVVDLVAATVMTRAAVAMRVDSGPVTVTLVPVAVMVMPIAVMHGWLCHPRLWGGWQPG